MTPRQVQALDVIRFELANFGVAPTMDEIGAKLGVTRQRASQLVADLDRLGKIRHRHNGQRAIELVDAPDLRLVDSQALRAELARRGENLDALARPGQVNWARRAVRCAADGCDVEVRRGHLMCWTHWSRLPRKLQDDIKRAYATRDAHAVGELVHEAREIATTRRVA